VKLFKSFILFIALLLFAATSQATVATSTSRAKFTCSGGSSYAFTFGVGATSEIQVVKTVTSTGVETTLTETTDYTISATNNDYSSGGTVTTTVACATGNTITIIRNVPLTQASDFTEGMPTLYESFESGLDKLTRITQQQQEEVDRSLRIPVSSSTSPTLPTPAANNYLGWNAGATGLENKSSPVITTATQYEVDALVSYGGGTSFTQGTIQAALTAIGTTNKATLLLRPGTWVISSNADWSAYTNVTFKIVPGAVFNGAFTINIPNICAGAYQIFDSTVGTVSGNINGNIRAEWWGLKADYIRVTETVTTDSYAALTSAIAYANANGGGIIELPPGAIYVGTVLQMKDNITIIGAGSGYNNAGTIIGTAGHLFQFTGQRSCFFRDFEVFGKTASTGAAFHFVSGTTHHLSMERVVVRSMANAIYAESVATLDRIKFSKSQFIYNNSWHVDFESGAVIEGLYFTDVNFDAQDNVSQAGLFRTVSASGWMIFTRCLFQSSASQYAVLIGGNASLSFNGGVFFNNANDSQGIITDGANIKIGAGNAIIEFNGVDILQPRLTAVNFYHIIADTSSWDPKIIVHNSRISLLYTVGLVYSSATYPINFEVSNCKFVGTPVVTPYDMLANAGTAPRRHDNDDDASGYSLMTNIVKQLTTTGAVATKIQGGQYTVQPSTNYLYTYEIIAKNADGSVYAAYSGKNLFTVAADRTITNRGALGDANVIETDAGMAVTFGATNDGTAPAGIVINVTGVSATTIDWVCHISILAIGTGGYPI
jgi:hypothetical protein